MNNEFILFFYYVLLVNNVGKFITLPTWRDPGFESRMLALIIVKKPGDKNERKSAHRPRIPPK